MADMLEDLPESLREPIMRALGMGSPEGAARRASEIDQALDLLAALGITGVVYRLDGGGDEGQSDVEEVTYADGRVEAALPELPIGFDQAGNVESIDDRLGAHAENAPSFDWINNEGGSGTVTYLPMAGEDERIVVDMHENTYDDDDDDDDDDGDDDADGTIVIGDDA